MKHAKKHSFYGFMAFASLTLLSTIGLSGDGTLPFGMAGAAAGKALSFSIDEVKDTPTSPSTRGPKCSQGFESVAAVGDVQYGNTSFAIKGICRKNGDRYEILSTDGTTTLKLGQGKVSVGSGSRTFEGTLLQGKVDGDERALSTFKLVD